MTSRTLLILFLVMLASLSCLQVAQAGNPLLTPRPAGDASDVSQDAGQEAGQEGMLSSLTKALAEWQLAIRTRMAEAAREIREHPYGRAFWMFMLLALGYGVVHALGPGHGKLVTASYFLSASASRRLGLLFGQMTMFFHVLTAAVIVLVGRYLLEITTSGSVDAMSGRIGRISYVLLMAVGCALLVKSVWDLARGGHGHHCHGPLDHDHEGRKGLVLFAFIAGMTPCPGSALILVFAISLGIQTEGLLALLFIALGMGMTISLIAVATIATRGFMLSRLERHERTYHVVHGVVSIAGALLLVLLGALLYWGQMAAMG